jgi:hypothetical protein
MEWQHAACLQDSRCFVSAAIVKEQPLHSVSSNSEHYMCSWPQGHP